MTYTSNALFTSGLNLYAKALPLNTATWSTGVVNYVENGSTGTYTATLDETIAYAIYRRLGGAPASTDLKIGYEAIKPATRVLVTPLTLEQRDRVLGNNVDLVTGETPLDAFDVLADASGNIPDLNTLTLEVIIETINKATRIVIADANIARDVEYASPSVPSAATAMWRWPSGVTTSPSEWRWSLRETANDTRLAGGLVTVTYEP